MMERSSIKFGALAWLMVALFAIAKSEITIQEPKSGKIYAQAGSDFRIKVVSTGSDAMEMCHQVPGASSCDKYVPSTTPNFKLFRENGQIVIEYTPKGIAAKDAGEYRITQGIETKSVYVSFVAIDVSNGTLYESGDDVSLACKVSGVDVKYTLTWVKDEQIITANERPVVILNDTFTVTKARPEDVGPYNCIVTPDQSTNNMTAVAYIHSAPFVKKFERAKNLVQGDTVSVECHVYGYPLPTVSWVKNEEPLKLDNRTMISAFNGIEGAKLVIRDLNMEDRADYGCLATNTYNTTTETIAVRVKDKYAALWPFLGICVEVIILCAIIFIYEKRRNNKKNQKEKSPEKTAAQNGKGEDVRQRNKNSVKA